MSLSGYRVLAVIPARGGSKGIMDKNLRTVRGMSLIARAARVIKEADVVDRAVCSTDSPRIAAEANQCGLEAPFLRPAELSSDNAKSVDVWRHAWLECERRDSVTYELSILVEPTSPLRRPSELQRTLAVLLDAGAMASVTVSRTPAHFTPHKTLTIGDNGRIGFYLRGGEKYSRRQDIPPFFHRNGVCYAARREAILDQGTILENDCVAVVIDRPLVNIDEPFDLEVAELLAAREAW